MVGCELCVRQMDSCASVGERQDPPGVSIPASSDRCCARAGRVGIEPDPCCKQRPGFAIRHVESAVVAWRRLTVSYSAIYEEPYVRPTNIFSLS